MLKLKALALLIIVVLLSGCATSPYSESGQVTISEIKLAEIRNLVSELVKLEKQKIPEPADRKRLARLHVEIQKFERDAIRKAIGHEQNDDWETAESILRQAYKVVPKSDVLRMATLHFANRRAIREEVIRTELAIHQGEQLLQNADIYSSLERVAPLKFLTRIEINAYQRKRISSANKLQQFADKALARENYYLAHRCLSMSLQLQQNEDVKQKLELAESKISQSKQRSRAESFRTTYLTSVDNSAAEFLAGEVRQALRQDHFLAAKKHLSKLRQRYPQYRGLDSIESQYHSQLERHIVNALEEGKTLYSKGKVDEALRVWRSVNPLAPNNVELLSSIARAEKVLENLRLLTTQESESE